MGDLERINESLGMRGTRATTMRDIDVINDSLTAAVTSPGGGGPFNPALHPRQKGRFGVSGARPDIKNQQTAPPAPAADGSVNGHSADEVKRWNDAVAQIVARDKIPPEQAAKNLAAYLTAQTAKKAPKVPVAKHGHHGKKKAVKKAAAPKAPKPRARVHVPAPVVPKT